MEMELFERFFIGYCDANVMRSINLCIVSQEIEEKLYRMVHI